MSDERPAGIGEPPASVTRVVRLPGFVADEPVGLGDVIKRASAAAGIRPCGGCEKRARQLNSWMAFTGRNT